MCWGGKGSDGCDWDIINIHEILFLLFENFINEYKEFLSNPSHIAISLTPHLCTSPVSLSVSCVFCLHLWIKLSPLQNATMATVIASSSVQVVTQETYHSRKLTCSRPAATAYQ